MELTWLSISLVAMLMGAAAAIAIPIWLHQQRIRKGRARK